MTRLPVLLATLLAISPIAMAQTSNTDPFAMSPTSLLPMSDIPRTPEGKPDFQGVVWATNYFPVFELSPLNPNLVVPEDEARRIVDTMFGGMAGFLEESIDPEAHVIMGETDGLPIVRGERRTRLIVVPASGKIPLTDEARKLARETDTQDGAKDDYEQRPTGERCLVLSGVPPIHAVISYNRQRIIQTPTHVVVHNENGDEARIIPFADEFGAKGPRSWYGDSIARWDGDTLEIRTTRTPQTERVRGLLTKFVVNSDAMIIERYTRLSATELLYQFTVEDASAYSEPWLAEFSFRAVDTGMFPSPCHEHNHSLPNILRGQRVADAEAVAG